MIAFSAIGVTLRLGMSLIESAEVFHEARTPGASVVVDVTFSKYFSARSTYQVSIGGFANGRALQGIEHNTNADRAIQVASKSGQRKANICATSISNTPYAFTNENNAKKTESQPYQCCHM